VIDKVYLVGFMACGKSTTARELSARLGWTSEDLDELIEHRERLTIADIFARQGEPYFRQVERELLRVLQPLRHCIVATGGGTFAEAESRALMNLDGVSVWLDVPLPELIPRIPLDGRRPLAASRADLERLFALRLESYRLAHVRIAASGLPVPAVVESILDALERLPGWRDRLPAGGPGHSGGPGL
jgi:shikimate kinase